MQKLVLEDGPSDELPPLIEVSSATGLYQMSSQSSEPCSDLVEASVLGNQLVGSMSLARG